MPRKLRIAFDDRHRTRSPAFIGRLKFRRDAQTECRNVLQRKCRAVIVINLDDDVGLQLRQYLSRSRETVEYRLPVIILGLPQIQSSPDGRYMRTADTGNDLRH